MAEAQRSRDDATTLAVLGSPIAHSKSPDLHAAAYAALGLDWQYQRVEMVPDRLAEFVRSRPPVWRGLSLTMPLKSAVLLLVDSIDEPARLTGAVNTVLFRQEVDGSRRLAGFNTDVAGIVRALQSARVNRPKNTLILGGGATATSAVAAVAGLGGRNVQVLARSPKRARPLIGLGSDLGVQVDILDQAGIGTGTWPGTGSADAPWDLVISTLPGGTGFAPDFARASRERAVLLDVAYDPWPSRLAADWGSVGGVVVSGLRMLLEQALIQVRIFVSGDPSSPLADEHSVHEAMARSVGLDGGSLSQPVPES